MAVKFHLLMISFFILAFFVLITFSMTNDVVVMKKFSASLSVIPSSWMNNDTCTWDGVTCDSASRITSINISSRCLSGSLPLDLGHLSNLRTLSIQYNFFHGDVPNLANLTFLQKVHLHNNNFTSIPSDFFSGLLQLESFSISNNQYLAPWAIPKSLFQDSNLEIFEASSANIIGHFPSELLYLPSIRLIDVSNNNMSGVMPEISSDVKVFFDGNQHLTRKTSNIVEPKPHKGVFVSTRVLIGIISIFLVIFLVIIACVLTYTCYIKKKSKKTSIVNKQIEMLAYDSCTNVYPIDVLQQATGNFLEENIIGRGGIGIVYKGELENGDIIAIKRMDYNELTRRGINEFETEIDLQTNVRHVHIVKLLGYYISTSERFLVYEYMAQGTLSHHLFGGMREGSSPLTWEQRVSIALDVARAVEYLHSFAKEIWIHLDLKPDNILLDDNMRAKIADFGMAKKNGERINHKEKLIGTIGYIAPECNFSHTATTKMDVFAFGVILINLLTCKRPIDQTIPKEEEEHISIWFQRLWESKKPMEECIDQNLYVNNEKTCEDVQKIGELACHCTVREPEHRPDMACVVQVLSGLIDPCKPLPPSSSDQNDTEFYGKTIKENLEIISQWEDGEGS